ncbi:hypothetical protein WISP_07728 [Willisornis vidua]|uniref:Uncharacterized protein n=1 Tax=Willisornis vidua TaxID=1566151 RepID=A0ABQ9DSD0_9PASS|nr:hypothetical protein WISP_07728 [Willisornis vidua]
MKGPKEMQVTFKLKVKAGDGEPCGSKGRRVIDMLETMAVPGNAHIGIKDAPSKELAGSIDQLNCTYTSSWNKQKDLEANRFDTICTEIRGKASKRDAIVRVYYRLPNQDGEADEIPISSWEQSLALGGFQLTR